MSSLFTLVFLASIVWFFVARRKDKKVNGKISKNTWYILILTAVSFILVGFTAPKADTVAEYTKQKKSAAKTSSSIKESSKVTSSKQSSSKTENKYDFSKIKYNMTMDQVISAIGKQPTDKSDYELYYDDDDFDFNDGKLIGSSVKSVQDKIDNKFKVESSSRKKEEANKSSQKSQAQYFGTRSVEYVQKHPAAYNSGKINNGMEYMYMIDKGSYLVRYDTDDGYTNVYSYDGNSENKLRYVLYTGRTIFNKPATKKYYYIGGK
ncbi:hypothetical protein [Leuconostoc citreum]|uniref:hypothetical protein n=1 Tax=Leuconostoc citreum TaxID=33964 RepID=UPI00209CDD4D|nr:hypothetical protein [Leuconostoc citreum]MCP1275465.1 hypothetical protein [Leuconostoc citreum]MCT3077187.1 hypothetical protein [Leuconostoc citreum]